MGGGRKALKAVIWVVLIYVVAEAGFRVYSFAQLKSQAAKHGHYGFTTFQSAIYVLDTQTGFAYKPNSHNHLWFYDAENELLIHAATL